MPTLSTAQHKEKLFRYVLEEQRRALQAGRGSGAPFMLLLPAWSASKLAWRQLVWCLARLRRGQVGVSWEEAGRGERALRVGAFSERLEERAGCFFVVPSRRYTFEAAVRAREEAPFDGVWFCGGMGEGALAALRSAQAAAAAAPEHASRTCASLAELRLAGVLPATDEVQAALTDEQRSQRKRALSALDDERRADPRHAERKRLRMYEQRASRVGGGSASTIGRALTPSERGLVTGCPKACRHFFGIDGAAASDAPGGCTRGLQCRFLHRVDGVEP